MINPALFQLLKMLLNNLIWSETCFILSFLPSFQWETNNNNNKNADKNENCLFFELPLPLSNFIIWSNFKCPGRRLKVWAELKWFLLFNVKEKGEDIFEVAEAKDSYINLMNYNDWLNLPQSYNFGSISK